MLKPGLEAADAGLDDGVGSEAVDCEPGERDVAEVVENGVAMLARGAEIDAQRVCRRDPLPRRLDGTCGRVPRLM